MRITRLIWCCIKCADVVVSYSHLRHDMNTCDCGAAAVDLEEDYMRVKGIIDQLSWKERFEGEWKKIEGKS